MPRSSATITRIPGLRVGQANDNISAPLNWRRGLWRLWVLASSAWLLGWGVYLSIWAIRSGFETGDLLAIPVLLLGPPLALLVFGLATSWAFKGFLPDKTAPDDQP
jgi:CHASE2 domain-containing sensor protein